MNFPFISASFPCSQKEEEYMKSSRSISGLKDWTKQTGTTARYLYWNLIYCKFQPAKLIPWTRLFPCQQVLPGCRIAPGSQLSRDRQAGTSWPNLHRKMFLLASVAVVYATVLTYIYIKTHQYTPNRNRLCRSRWGAPPQTSFCSALGIRWAYHNSVYSAHLGVDNEI